MNYNQHAQVFHKCSGCPNIIPTGKENPCWTAGSTYIINQLFCSLCKSIRGRDFSKPYSDLVGADLEKMEIIDSPEFKKWREYKEKGYLSEHFEENTKKLAKELEEDYQERLKEDYNLGVGSPQATRARNLNIEKPKETQNEKELVEELERIRWGLPKIDEKE